jgi:hypothetical protein
MPGGFGERTLTAASSTLTIVICYFVQELHLRLTDDSDLFFLYTLALTEDEFGRCVSRKCATPW